MQMLLLKLGFGALAAAGQGQVIGLLDALTWHGNVKLCPSGEKIWRCPLYSGRGRDITIEPKGHWRSW